MVYEEVIKQKRVIFKHIKGEELPTVVFIAGLHGNEYAGIKALESFFSQNNGSFDGNIYALAGNLSALEQGKRFLDLDLNRIWSEAFLKQAHSPTLNPSQGAEFEELAALDHYIQDIIDAHSKGEVYFFDLHTTSSRSCPFIPFNDALMNRDIAQKFPVPLILGIEEQLEGPLMSYINDMNLPALAFEAGQHDDPVAVDVHQCFIALSLHHLKIRILTSDEIVSFESMLHPKVGGIDGFYEVIHHHRIKPESGFIMTPGFGNFDAIKKGTLIAKHHEDPVLAPSGGRIFLPLYQDKGEDGFFIIRNVSRFWLWISKWLRVIKISSLLPLLPGIHSYPHQSHTYLANPAVTSILPKQIFHILGYRVRKHPTGKWLLIRRDY